MIDIAQLDRIAHADGAGRLRALLFLTLGLHSAFGLVETAAHLRLLFIGAGDERAVFRLLPELLEFFVDRVGGTETLKVDVRVLATTNRDLEDWVKQGKFRQDLYFRLNVIPLRLPSLRERSEDIPQLAETLLARLSDHRF